MTTKQYIKKLAFGFVLMIFGIASFFVAGALQDDDTPELIYNLIGASGFLWLGGSIWFFWRHRKMMMEFEMNRNKRRIENSGSYYLASTRVTINQKSLLAAFDKYKHKQIADDTIWVAKRYMGDSFLYLIQFSNIEDDPTPEELAERNHMITKLLEVHKPPRTQYKVGVFVITADNLTSEQKDKVQQIVARARALAKTLGRAAPLALYYLYDEATQTIYYEPHKRLPIVIREEAKKFFNTRLDLPIPKKEDDQ